jgi:hypothetical protein
VSEAKCSSCGAAIIWTVTAAGKRMPVDAAPVGKVTVLRTNPADAITPLSRQVDHFVSHFATCKFAERHRSAPPKKEDSSDA